MVRCYASRLDGIRCGMQSFATCVTHGKREMRATLISE